MYRILTEIYKNVTAAPLLLVQIIKLSSFKRFLTDIYKNYFNLKIKLKFKTLKDYLFYFKTHIKTVNVIFCFYSDTFFLED